MYGYRQIAGHCVDCMTWDEAIEVANIYAQTGSERYRVEGEHIQHFHGDNISSQHVYCWNVTKATEENSGNQRTKRIARVNGRTVRPSEGSKA